MPTLFRFLITLGVLAAIGFAAVVGLALFVQPTQTEMSVTIPPTRFNR